MLTALRTHARAVRALIALICVLGLGLTYAVSVVQRGEQDAAFVRRVNAMLWGVSELNYAGQVLAKTLTAQSADPSQIEATRMAFDVMWSRSDVIRREDLQVMDWFEEVLEAYKDFLYTNDKLIFSETPLEPEVALALAEEVTEIARISRQTWLQYFGTRASPDEIRRTLSVEDQAWPGLEPTVLILIILLCTYVGAEVLFAGKSQRRESRLREAAGQASEAKSRFIATVSHEVRTPLNGIIGTAEGLSRTKLTTEQRRYVTVLQQAGDVLLAIINDVLDFSKLEAGQFTIVNADFEVNDVLSAAQELFLPLARQKSIALTVWSDREDIPRLHGDGRRLQQVLGNLISNAIKFTDVGAVEVTARFEAEGDAPGLYIAVADTGCGIAENEIASVFSPFKQTSSGLSRSHEGTGLGLTISRDLCRAMGGDLTLTSRLGRGSTFEVWVPFTLAAAPVAAAQSDAQEGDLPDLSAEDVLIVDDNRTNRFILHKMLSPLGTAPREAPSGDQALTQSRAQMPSLIFMDVQMPVMDGVEATQRVLGLAREMDVAPPLIIGVTANTQEAQIERYLAAGMDHVMAKPVRRQDLLALLSQIHAPPRVVVAG